MTVICRTKQLEIMENFWNHNYRHEMRTLKPSLQTEVRDAAHAEK